MAFQTGLLRSRIIKHQRKSGEVRFTFLLIIKTFIYTDFNRRLKVTCLVKNCKKTWDILAKHHNNTGNFWLHFNKRHPEIPRNTDDIEPSESVRSKCFISFLLSFSDSNNFAKVKLL